MDGCFLATSYMRDIKNISMDWEGERIKTNLLLGGLFWRCFHWSEYTTIARSSPFLNSMQVKKNTPNWEISQERSLRYASVNQTMQRERVDDDLRSRSFPASWYDSSISLRYGCKYLPKVPITTESSSLIRIGVKNQEPYNTREGHRVFTNYKQGRRSSNTTTKQIIEKSTLFDRLWPNRYIGFESHLRMKLYRYGIVQIYVHHHLLDSFLFAVVLSVLIEKSSHSFGSPIFIDR